MVVRREASSPATRRYARSLPQFQPADDVPRYMLDMLKQLESAEAASVRNKN